MFRRRTDGSERDDSLKQFKEVERGLITNARCLTEGVDVPSVDMVAFMSPRKSRVDIVQAVGRAMRKAGPEKKFGYLLVPLFLNRRKGETLQQAFERSDFDEVATVINAMQEQDEDLAEIIRELRQQKGETGGYNESRLKEKIEVLGPEVSLKELKSSISARLVEQIGVNWDEMFGQLLDYKKKNGDCNVPIHLTRKGLGGWVNWQRYLYNNGRLTEVRAERLRAVGFIWDTDAFIWERNYGRLVEYRLKHGDCNVPVDFPSDQQLGTWVGNQRTKRGRLNADQNKRLEELGFVWDVRTTNWDETFKRLVEYRKRHHDCNVPDDYPQDQKLGIWAGLQRYKKRLGKLDAKRVIRLEAIGFKWRPIEDAWERMFRRLVTYRKRHGDCLVGRDYKDRALAVWVGTQRQTRKQGQLDPERVTRLQKLGFVWDAVTAAWEEQFRHLVSYKKRHGDCNVPRTYKDKQLVNWIGTQRQFNRSGKLEAARVSRLDRMGFIWDPHESAWNDFFQRLAEYKRKHGDCNVPYDFKDKTFADWVSSQRQFRKRGKLDLGRIARLDQLGFMWDPRAKLWEEMYGRLIAYKQLHKHCNIPQNYKENSLAVWVHTQRRSKKLEKLDLDRVRRLNQIGFLWDPPRGADAIKK